MKVWKANDFEKFSGLMFKSIQTKPILFEFNNDNRIAIHSFFVFFPFLAVWFTDDNRISELKIVKPFTIHVKPKKNFRKLLEIPLNYKNKRIIEFLVGERNI